MARPTKRWEVFPGRNKFFCDGRVMMAPHTGVFCITVFLIVATSILFFVFDCPFLAVRVSPFIPAVSGLLFVFTMSALLRTSFSDPGVIPRASVEEAALYDKQIEVGTDSNSPTFRPPPRAKEIMVRGQPIKLKYCFTCKMFRPPRASHCSLCDNCVDRFDHHCPWVGNCVGRRNYRYFYMFIVSLAFLCVFMFACVVTHLVMITRDAAFLDALKDSPASVLIAVVCFFSVWSVLGLAGFHTYLASSNQTTNEDIKGSFSGKRGSEGRNPYSEGNVCSNCFHVLCGPVPPSLLDRRGQLTQEMLDEMERANAPENPTQYGTVKTQPQNGGVFPPLHETCGTPNPLQQQCKGSGQANGKTPQSTPANGSTSGSLTRLVRNEQPTAIWHTGSHPLSDLPPPIDIDDVLPRSPSSITLRSFEDSQVAQEQMIMSNIDRTLHGDLRQLTASRLRRLQESTMIESALDLDPLDEGLSPSANGSQSGAGGSLDGKQPTLTDATSGCPTDESLFSADSQVVLLNSPYVTPVYH